MNDIEIDLLNFIKDKDIDFLSSDKIDLNITFEDYQFTLTSQITFIDGEEYELMVDCTLLKNFTSLVPLSNEFRESVAEYFLIRINHEQEYVIYCLRLNNCLRDNNIMYNS
jgi:hypothetical protein